MTTGFTIIEFAPGFVSGCVFQSGKVPVACVSEPVRAKGQSTGYRDAVARLMAAMKEKSYSGALQRVYASLSPKLLSIRVVQVPFSDREKINGVLPFDLSGLLPGDAEDIVIDNVPLEGSRAIAVAAEKRLVKECLEALAEAGIDPDWLGAAAFSAPCLVKEVKGKQGRVAFISRDFICLCEGGRPVFLSPFSGPEALRLSLEVLASEGITPESVLCSGIDLGLVQGLLPGIAVEKIPLPEVIENMAALYALALQVEKGRLKDIPNFRRGEFGNTREKAAKRRKQMLAAVLCGFLVAAGAADIYFRHRGAAREYHVYEDALKKEYSDLFHGEKGTGDEVYNLEVRLKLLDKETAVLKGIGALEFMRKLAAEAPADNSVTIIEIDMGENRASAKGEAASFEVANRYRDSLAKSFREVLLSDIKAEAGGGAAFTLSIRI